MSTAAPTPSPVAVVTGGTAGLGLALVDALVARAWHVVTDGRRPDLVEDLRRRHGNRVTAIEGDIAFRNHRDEIVAAVQDRGRLDLLVNNASTIGSSPMPRLADLPVDELDRVLQVNLVAPFDLVRALLPELRAARGVVVNVSSDAAVEAYQGWGAYSTSKAALDHLSRLLAAEEPDLRVLAVDPGDMRTELHQLAFPGEDISDRPVAAESVPALLYLIDAAPSGRHRVAAVREAVVSS